MQRLWTNLKQRQRKELAKKRQHRIATGEGEAIGDAIIDSVIEIINPNLLVKVLTTQDFDK